MKQPITTSIDTAAVASLFDVVVAGATPAGIAAAIAAARCGLCVALIDPLPGPGQMLSNGLCVFDTAHRAGVVGIMSEFAGRVAVYHREHYGEQDCVRENRGAPRHGTADGLSFEPKIAELVLNQMIAETDGLSYFSRHQLIGAIKDGKRCIGIQCRKIEGHGFDPRWTVCYDNSNGSGIVEFKGRAVIDATYEGDIAAWAGVPFRVGREARSIKEPHNGMIMTDYFEGTNAVREGWLPETFWKGSTGAADHKVMAYNVRYVIKNYGRKEGAHRLPRPKNYDPKKFKRQDLVWSKGYLPNQKQFVNWTHCGNDMQGDLLSTYPDGTPEQRRKVLEALYELAYEHLYFLQTELGNETWGLADDEFTLNGGWPYCVYVREARRIVGISTLTESDVHRWLPRSGDDYFTGIPGDRSRPALQKDSIAVGDYDIDCHLCDGAESPDYPLSGEGGLLLSSVRAPFQIPYGCMVPQSVEGLLVACAVSVSHVAMCVVRMEPVWAQLGQAAGIAAALAIKTKRTFQELEPQSVQAALIEGACQLYYYTDVSPSHPSFGAIQRLSLRGVMRGFQDWSFRPERPLTRAEWSQMLASAFNLWPSVTANHFDDVPPDHPAFLAFETLYDYGARVGIPVVPFERRQKVWCDDSLGHRVYAKPDLEITWKEAYFTAQLLVRALRQGGFSGIIPQEGAFESHENASRYFTRADGAKLLDWLARQGGGDLRLQTHDADDTNTNSHGAFAACTEFASGLIPEPAENGSNGHML